MLKGFTYGSPEADIQASFEYLPVHVLEEGPQGQGSHPEPA
jgi:hypothetical protein